MEGREMNNRKVLTLIAAFLVLTVGSFIWYVATWDDRASATRPYHLAKNTPAGGQVLSKNLSPILFQRIDSRPANAVFS